ncbi:UNVERIFIED_CONTAM: Heterogeneous nuclear ribonucleoprotein Q [Sesamum radiatum]|uniref:Heterogeneous nuclear ribonucleoprotein Q n=1 Tax=Sesamum radiatum TaxID=300843 RepID=A0AAW2KRB9_SESRA
MPRTRASAAATKSAEAEKPVEADEQVELGADNDMEEALEEEVEYEEVEEEVEVEEEEEVEEEVEEEEEVEDEDEEDEVEGHGVQDSDDDIKNEEGEDEVRIMKGKDSNENKGYAFVTFRNKELASKAIKELNNTELKGKKLKCSTSQAKHKLFIGNVPRNWGEEDMKKIVNKAGPGVIAVELLKDPQNSSRNRGFAFVEYYNHACAEYSKKKMSNPNFKLDDNAPTVSWADPKSAESSSSQVKAVYVKNLPKNVTQDQLKALFEHHGKITKVVLPPAKPGHEKSRYGFVHFAERSNAMKALKNTEKYEIDGQVVECSLAKPQADQKTAGGSNSQKSAILPTYPPRVGYGLVGSPYGALGAGYPGANFTQPLIYGRGASPGMAMMPMLLPDGRIGYVLQQPGVQPHTPPPQQRGGRSSGGGSSSGGRRGSNSGRGRSRYSPY